MGSKENGVKSWILHEIDCKKKDLTPKLVTPKLGTKLGKNTSVRVPKKFLHIDKKLKSAYEEIITSYKHGLYIICSMGIRALLEGICVHEGITDKEAYRLDGKITQLQNDNRVPSGIIEGLKRLKPIGDDAAHGLDAAAEYSIDLAIDLLEALLTHLYEAKFDLELKARQVQYGKKNIFAGALLISEPDIDT